MQRKRDGYKKRCLPDILVKHLFLLYKSILIFRHLNPCYAEQKVTYTRLLFLLLLRMWQKKVMTASMHGQMLSPT
ncbi:hypothetical protein CON65_06440 [Bacillus pseudomycoides]|uniref:Uncharacterized protein n=1 Tax=Bacillus pseudomycoides TaxID=64104 RepID=A0AA91VDY0_9BACI|nr:hypothetical protein COO03_12170 [Bacillus sp. AFS098217]PED83506.1 hypothetical protein CON65_06440 [Bacillus pseudomycoides]PEU21983.1 hypothetical protein CN525_00860 [Bacillus sp. AFS014408]